MTRSGPLNGVRVIEIAGLGAAPFAAMLLADLGADVIRVDRPGRSKRADAASARDPLLRGRRSIVIDLKRPEGTAIVLRLVKTAEVLIEGFRPGVAERMGVGPDDCRAVNPRLVYGRMTGWGQSGPYATMAGHDINYIAVAGVLYHLGRAGELPAPPLNLIGDMGGGGLLLSLGVVSALLEARATGAGQVVDAAMVDGAALLMTSIYGSFAEGSWTDARGSNLLDSGAPFYDVYETADGGLLSVGALERRFFEELLRRCGLDPDEWPDRMDRRRWTELRRRLAERFRDKPRDEWCAIFHGSDACVAPVLSAAEAADDVHNRHRGTFLGLNGVVQPAPAPRFSRTPLEHPRRPPRFPGEHTDEVLAEIDFDVVDRERLRDVGVVA
ncbi:MAG: CaiB/BaiF CoA-transferase family protein [Actinomycetota bacterium]